MEFIRNKKKLNRKKKRLEILGTKNVNYENNILLKDDEINTVLKIKAKKIKTFDKYNTNFIIKILYHIFKILLFLYFLFFKISEAKKKNNFITFNNNTNYYKYYACFCGIGRQENKYAREFIEYYINLGVEKFIIGDNNLPNTEKLSDILQDYISNGTVNIIKMFGSTLGQSEFGQIIYEKYKSRCGWFLYFDFDEYLKIFFKKN